MPVKKLGSKLAQGVRQVQAQQVDTPSPTTEACASAAPDDQAKGSSTAHPDEKPPLSPRASGDERSSTPRSEGHKNLHPRRVWPD
ncbi:hypothetical protein [Acidithiobacillus ferrivorans]|uniref:hypothetical protein n=1 Tax=Acidithiobacillus ferrivorans TaxID=160808 RepID=UPI001C0794FE|nr:hypothetical protein [Acidithiobacillus ferrivorans]MBU2851796.1 hypothetical protein [Acidithiobacillus ferrivorans]